MLEPLCVNVMHDPATLNIIYQHILSNIFSDNKYFLLSRQQRSRSSGITMEEIRLLSEEASEAAQVVLVDQVATEDQDGPEDEVGPGDEVGREALEERNIQAKLLELESQAEVERSKLAQLKRQHLKTSLDSVDEACGW